MSDTDTVDVAAAIANAQTEGTASAASDLQTTISAAGNTVTVGEVRNAHRAAIGLVIAEAAIMEAAGVPQISDPARRLSIVAKATLFALDNYAVDGQTPFVEYAPEKTAEQIAAEAEVADLEARLAAARSKTVS